MRHTRQVICSAAAAGSIAFVSLMAATNGPAAGADAACVAPADLVRLDLPLERTARQLASRKLTLIVALGSSSTAGSGASSPGASYPSRLMVELAHRFPTEPIMVLNRGIAGERAVDMLARFDDAVASEHPDLVLWQLGTNAVLRGYEHAKSDSVIREGIRRIKATGADAVLIDPQYAPKVIARSQVSDMVDLISSAAAQEKVDVFHRFALMRYWHEHEGFPFETFLSADGLHMNDWGHGCLAKALADAIADAAALDQTSRKDNLESETATTGEAH
ncbi:MAG TPA: GDSL-type esterase/lipase family protein [Xanthobacteraceae bacterium]|nr:GDSL-type esterase/lipase family protein [Xanthobacteraceae bacterium]